MRQNTNNFVKREKLYMKQKINIFGLSVFNLGTSNVFEVLQLIITEYGCATKCTNNVVKWKLANFEMKVNFPTPHQYWMLGEHSRLSWFVKKETSFLFKKISKEIKIVNENTTYC